MLTCSHLIRAAKAGESTPMAPEPIDYATPPTSSPKRSRLAIAAACAPFLSVAAGCAMAGVADSLGRAKTSAVAELRELLCILPPFLGATLVGIAAIIHVSNHRSRLSGLGMAIAGTFFSAALGALAFFLIVLSHSWLD
jgi:hypothetical protein